MIVLTVLFLFLIDGNLRKCNWVNTERCAIDGASLHCPLACSTCATDRCLDSSLEFNVEYNGKPPRAKVCDWVKSQQINTRCAIDGVKETCKETCDFCYAEPSSLPSTTPSTSPLPSVLPSVRPYVQTNENPSYAPSCYVLCVESPLRFKGDNSDGKYCASVKKKIRKRCKDDRVSSHCPVTCGSCATEKCSDSAATFILELDRKPNRDNLCDWVLQSQTNGRCAYPGVLDTCRESYDYCKKYSTTLSLAPSVLLSMRPSVLPSVTPSINPSALPSSRPSSTPSTFCEDSKFQFTSPDGSGNKWAKTPLTCGRCDRCVDSSLDFKMSKHADNLTSCINQTDEECGTEGVFHTCRVTCGLCPSLLPSMSSSMPSRSTDPSSTPTVLPSVTPSTGPSLVPSASPSRRPSLVPSTTPSSLPSSSPSVFPSSIPSLGPSTAPSSLPSLSPSVSSSSRPSLVPSTVPSSLPSLSPSVSRSSDPSLFPSTSPSSTPSTFCEDSIFNFKTFDESDTKYLNKCKLIENEDIDKVCGYKGVGSHCPVTCGRCDRCADSSLDFKLTKNADKFTSCVEQMKEDCGTKGVFHTCRVICGLCPSLLPSMSPSVKIDA